VDLEAESRAFAQSLESTLRQALPGEHEVVVTRDDRGNKFNIRPTGSSPWSTPLFVGGEHLASLGFNYGLAFDHRGQFPKVTESSFTLFSTLESTPLLRLEFLDAANRAPKSHWQFHADRGAFSHLLARSHAVRPKRARTPHDLSRLHLPLGGTRFRPCLEDFLEMLIKECGIDAQRQWHAALESGRQEWREKQTSAAVRDKPDIAAETLRSLGWKVTAPRRKKSTKSQREANSW